MFRSRVNYWSSSRLAAAIRGTKKPRSLPLGEWDKWHEHAKAANPIRYWVAEELLDWLQDVVYYPSDLYWSVRHYIRNRWVTKTYALVAKPEHVKRGEWCDLSYRILYANMDALVEFVELEKAHMYRMCFDENLSGAAAGIYYLENEIERCEDDPQGQAAKEILDIYQWWTVEYPERPDPYDVSGYSEYCVKNPLFAERDDEDREYVSGMLDMITKMELEYQNEDTEMLIRLMKVRMALWT